jgi:hypothetical protein
MKGERHRLSQAEWKVSDTGSAHWASSFNSTLIFELQKLNVKPQNGAFNCEYLKMRTWNVEVSHIILCSLISIHVPSHPKTFTPRYRFHKIMKTFIKFYGRYKYLNLSTKSTFRNPTKKGIPHSCFCGDVINKDIIQPWHTYNLTTVFDSFQHDD